MKRKKIIDAHKRELRLKTCVIYMSKATEERLNDLHHLIGLENQSPQQLAAELFEKAIEEVHKDMPTYSL